VGLSRKGENYTLGWYEEIDGVHVIGLDPKSAGGFESLTGTVAHELCRPAARRGRITADREDNERLTDLHTVFLGFGVFRANATLSSAEAANRPAG
jgi:hypothetical protein